MMKRSQTDPPSSSSLPPPSPHTPLTLNANHAAFLFSWPASRIYLLRCLVRINPVRAPVCTSLCQTGQFDLPPEGDVIPISTQLLSGSAGFTGLTSVMLAGPGGLNFDVLLAKKKEKIQIRRSVIYLTLILGTTLAAAGEPVIKHTSFSCGDYRQRRHNPLTQQRRSPGRVW